MAKLQGAAKAAFLKRINKGRVKAGLKKISSKTKSAARKVTRRRKSNKTNRKTNKPKRRNSNVVFKKRRGGRRGSGIMRRLKRVAIGAVLGIAVTAVVARVAPQFAEPAGQIAAASQGIEGVVGKIAIEQFVPQIRQLLGGAGQANGNGAGEMV